MMASCVISATIDNVKYVYGVAPPVANSKPGNILEANSLDCFGNALQKPGDSFALIKGDNPLTGPFYIDGAEPGDTLVVHILDLQVDGKQGVGTFSPGFGAVNATHYTPMLETKPLPEKMWFYPIDAEKNTATFQALDSNFKVSFPLHPFLGCIGVAPANGEARSSIVPAEFGGNMDAPEVSKGNTLYLPVNVTGALFYFGDGHAAMGDGEVAGSAVEVPMRARLRLDLLKKKRIDWPRLENENEIMTTGIYRPVDDAVRIAVTELVHWIHADYGLSDLDAYELCSKVCKLHLTEMVDPNYVVVASMEKKYLARKTAREDSFRLSRLRDRETAFILVQMFSKEVLDHFQESAQRRRTSRRHSIRGGQQSGLRGCSAPGGTRRERRIIGSAISLPRLHHFDRLRFAADGTADRKSDSRELAEITAETLVCFVRRIAAGNHARRASGRRRSASAAASNLPDPAPNLSASKKFRRLASTGWRVLPVRADRSDSGRSHLRWLQLPPLRPLCAHTTARAPWSSGAPAVRHTPRPKKSLDGRGGLRTPERPPARGDDKKLVNQTAHQRCS